MTTSREEGLGTMAEGLRHIVLDFIQMTQRSASSPGTSSRSTWNATPFTPASSPLGALPLRAIQMPVFSSRCAVLPTNGVTV